MPSHLIHRSSCKWIHVVRVLLHLKLSPSVVFKVRSQCAASFFGFVSSYCVAWAYWRLCAFSCWCLLPVLAIKMLTWYVSWKTLLFFQIYRYLQHSIYVVGVWKPSYIRKTKICFKVAYYVTGPHKCVRFYSLCVIAAHVSLLSALIGVCSDLQSGAHVEVQGKLIEITLLLPCELSSEGWI